MLTNTPACLCPKPYWYGVCHPVSRFSRGLDLSQLAISSSVNIKNIPIHRLFSDELTSNTEHTTSTWRSESDLLSLSSEQTHTHTHWPKHYLFKQYLDNPMALGPPRPKAMWIELRVGDCAKITYIIRLKKGHESKAVQNKRDLFKGNDIMRNSSGLNETQTRLHGSICFRLVPLPRTWRVLQRAKTAAFPQALCRLTSLLNWVTLINALIIVLTSTHRQCIVSGFFSLFPPFPGSGSMSTNIVLEHRGE